MTDPDTEHPAAGDADHGRDIDDEGYPAYVEFTVRMNVESGWEFDQLRNDISTAARRMSTVRLVGDEAAVQVLYRRRPGIRPIDSDPQEPPPFTFEHTTNP